MNMSNTNRNRRGQANQGVIIAIAIAAVVIIGSIIGYAIHRHNVEAAKTSSQAHIAACHQLQAQILRQQGTLSGTGLKFQPYQSRFDSAERELKTAETVLSRDPQAADKISAEAEGHFQSVLSDLNLAIEVKTDSGARSALSNAEERVEQARRQTIDLNYPGTSSRSEKLRLEEEDNNPDAHISAARRSLDSIDGALEAGDPRSAAASLKNAKSSAASATACIDRAFSSKKRVESELTAILQKSEGSDSSYESSVKAAYFEHKFVSAARRMDALNQRIEDRRETREVVAYCQRLQRDVARSLEDNANFTSTSTDQKFESLKNQLNSLAESLKQDHSNWTDLKSSGQSIEKSLNAVRDEAVQSRRDYDDALVAVKNFRRDFEDADRNGTPPLSFLSQSLHNELTDATKQKVNVINDISTRIERQIRLTKQDWRQVKRDAEDGIQKLKDAKQAVNDDNKKWDELSELKTQLKQSSAWNAFSCTINGRNYSGADASRRDSNFSSHLDEASARYDAAVRAWRAGEQVGYSEAVRSLRKELGAVNNIGWFNLLRQMRNSNDRVAQRTAWNNGYRDDKTCTEWVDGFVSKRATSAGGLWQPDLNGTNGGGADFGPAPDFKAPWN